MPDVNLEYSLSEVKRAGKILRDQEPGSENYGHALEVFQNWRNCHTVPLNVFYDSLKKYVQQKSRLTYVVHRPKRIDAVIAKLQRDRNAQLSTMQDIAGCRAIVKSIDDIDPFVEGCKQMWSQHTLRETYDYIEEPNPRTGYRGIHLVYKFHSENKCFNGRLIEIQIRTREQHAWATTVETVDLVERQALKSGNGDRRWQRFFSLMSSAMANRESRPIVPNTPSDLRELENELRSYADSLQVLSRFRAYGDIAKIVKPISQITTTDVRSPIRSWLFLIQLDLESGETVVKPYRESAIRRAYADVADAERAGKNVVLAAAQDFEQLREAYPNWFVDAHNFLILLKKILGEEIPMFP
jgi:ppGpp synthetase/RelA/SpoT-type nucleotidyltranferase